MAKVLTARTLQASASQSAGGSTTGSAFDLSAGFGMLVIGKITNGGSGPTLPAGFRIEVSNDNSNWFTFCEMRGRTSAGQQQYWAVDLPPTVMWARSYFFGNTAQAVTVECMGMEWTTLV